MSDFNYCDAEAVEDPRFDYAGPTFAPPPGTWAPDCSHEACVNDDQACPDLSGFHGWGCPVAECRWNAARATCDFTVGHAGDHSYALRMLPMVDAPLPGLDAPSPSSPRAAGGV